MAENTETPHSEHLPGCWRKEPFQLLHSTVCQQEEGAGPIPCAAQGSGKCCSRKYPRCLAGGNGAESSRQPLQARLNPLPVPCDSGRLGTALPMSPSAENRQQLPPEASPGEQHHGLLTFFPCAPEFRNGSCSRGSKAKGKAVLSLQGTAADTEAAGPAPEAQAHPSGQCHSERVRLKGSLLVSTHQPLAPERFRKGLGMGSGW